MHFEYAVEPEAMAASWQDFRYLIEKFGFEKGRLIARFPRKWERYVRTLVRESDISTINQARIIEKLRAASQTALIDSRPTSQMQADNWLEAAIIEDQSTPFRAIIARQNTNGNQRIVVTDDTMEDRPLFRVDPSVKVPKTPEGIAEALHHLISHASGVEIIDPFFQPLGDKFRPTLQALLAMLGPDEGTEHVLKIHRRFKPEEKPTEAECNNLKNEFSGALPSGWVVEVYLWEDLPEDEDYHDRHLLTDLGGISLGSGFEVTGKHQNVNLTYLSIGNCMAFSKRFAVVDGSYRLGCELVRITNDGVSMIEVR